MSWRCRTCDLYRDNVNAATGRLQWAKVQRDPEAIKEAEDRLAGYRAGWEQHRSDAGCNA
ncbi:hypothetical protein [Streptomyces sp. NPDC051162]|uniref:hypothetical protein n=1 Tax=Streptomyces sp. NPDC051162 TaxID=3154747 RepID=UPI003440D266